jgi:hypothetical protein
MGFAKRPSLWLTLALLSGCGQPWQVMVAPSGTAPSAVPSAVAPLASAPEVDPSTQPSLSVAFGQEEISLRTGESQELAVWLRDGKGAPFRERVTWFSNNVDVAKVDLSTGRVEGLADGFALITAESSRDASWRAIFEVTVATQHAVSLIAVMPATLSIRRGGKHNLGAVVTMHNGERHGNVLWSSSDERIATVDRETGEIHAKREGRVTILATYAVDKRYRGLAEITVEAEEPSPRPSPSPEVFTFAPGATPLPVALPASPSASPEARSTPAPHSPTHRNPRPDPDAARNRRRTDHQRRNRFA